MVKCDNIINLGCFGSCEDIELPILADSTCQYTMKYLRAGFWVINTVAVKQGCTIKVPSYMLNENATVQLTFFKADSTQIFITSEEVEYCAFQITTIPQTTTNKKFTVPFCVSDACT